MEQNCCNTDGGITNEFQMINDCCVYVLNKNNLMNNRIVENKRLSG